MEFCGNFVNKPHIMFEENDGEDIVETAGYITAKQQIEEMLYAGQRLADYRAEMYDYGPEDEDDGEFTDPTRRPGFDMADASMMMQNLEEEVKVSRRRKASEKAVEEEVQENNTGVIPSGGGSAVSDTRKGTQAAQEGV